MKLLKQLYKIYSPSGREWAMIKFIKRHVKSIPEIKLGSDKYGNLYITKGISNSYPCIVAHMDQVQRLHSKDFIAIESRDIIIGYSPRSRRQEGLGADDKNGIWIALKCLEKYDTLKIALFREEEIGCIGSRQANMSFFEDTRFVIEPDRRGHSDLITSIGWEELCSKEFLKQTNYRKFGYREETGMMTDIQELKERGLSVSCINLSCGYYEPHTDQEFTVKKDLLNALRFVEHIIENCQEVYNHQTEELDYYKSNYIDDIDLAREDIFIALDIDSDLTTDDLIDAFELQYPSLDRADLIAIYKEYYQSNNELKLEEEYYGK